MRRTVLHALIAMSTLTPTARANPLHDLERAIGMNNSKLFDRSLPKVTDVDQTFNPLGETPLTLAAYHGRYEMVSVLLERGADVNHRTKNGYSALIFAAMVTHGRVEDARKTVRALLAAGADKTARNADGQTARDLALKHDANLAEMLK